MFMFPPIPFVLIITRDTISDFYVMPSRVPYKTGVTNRYVRPSESAFIDRRMCWSHAKARFPDSDIVEALNQSRCPYTVVIYDRNMALHFRSTFHYLDLDITRAARAVFGHLVPATRLMDYDDGL